MNTDNTISKSTKILASYACLNYSFNRKIRHKFRKSTANFLSNNDSVDYEYLLKATNSARYLHNVYFTIMFVLGIYIINVFTSIEEYYSWYGNIHSGSVFTLFIICFVAWLVSFIYELVKYKMAFKDINKAITGSLRVPSNEQNICVFSGQKPFIGSGNISKSFSFIITTNKVNKKLDNSLSVIEFSESEIYNSISEKVSKNYNSNQKLYLNGSYVNNDSELVSALKTGKLEQSKWESYAKVNTDEVRRYISLQSANKNNEIESSTFIRFSKSNNSLFVELTSTVLLPIAKRYRVIENLPYKMSFGRILLLSQTSIFSSMINIFRALFYGAQFFLADIFTILFEEKQIRKQIKENFLFDFGEQSSLRENVSDTSIQTFYNSMDKEQLSKQIEKELFEHLIDFLDSKNVDTSELTQQEATIINNGLIMSGGEVNADNVSVGKMSKILQRKKA